MAKKLFPDGTEVVPFYVRAVSSGPFGPRFAARTYPRGPWHGARFLLCPLVTNHHPLRGTPCATVSAVAT